ncbi:hypothetical protein NCC49_004301 [Naganishia albida]|nr:hypothetical protein NCC49_004301 [Naganishia albida]
MAVPWSHWSPALPYPTSAVEYPEDEVKRKEQTEAKLQDIVQGYVERASNEDNRDLLNTIISVLVTRLSQGYPYNIKSLDILIHLLHAHLLPHPAFYPPTSLLYAPIIALATASPQDDPSGVAGHVKAKADEFLTGIGYEVRLGSAWMGRGTATDGWGRSAWMGLQKPSAWESHQPGFSLSTTTVSRGQVNPSMSYA